MDYRAFYLIKEGYGDYTNNQANWTSLSRLIKGKSSRCNRFKTEEEAKYFILKKGLVTKEEMKTFMNSLKKEKEVEKTGIKDEILIFLDPNCVYCDGSVTNGKTKSRVTDAERNSLIKEILLNDKKFNDFLNFKKWKYDDGFNCNIEIEGMDNIAFGETLALYLGIEIAIRKGLKGYENAELLIAVTDKRKEFENKGGVIKHIYGEINPADFGGHPIPDNIRFTTEKKKNSITIEEYFNKKKQGLEEKKLQKKDKEN